MLNNNPRGRQFPDVPTLGGDRLSPGGGVGPDVTGNCSCRPGPRPADESSTSSPTHDRGIV